MSLKNVNTAFAISTRHSYALEKVTCPNVVLDKFDDVAESDYYDERGNYDADCRGDTAKNAATLYAYISCGVYRDWPRRAFGNGENIAQFVVSDPLLFFDEFRFDERKHGVSSAKGKQAYFEKYAEQFEYVQKVLFSAFLFHAFSPKKV